MNRSTIIHAASLIGTIAGIASAEPTQIRVDAAQPGRAASQMLTASCIEDVNHEIYGGLYSQMIFGESFQERPRDGVPGVSGMWTLSSTGGPSASAQAANASAQLEFERPFIGMQSLRLTLNGPGQCSLSNRGLNRWGLGLVEKKPYEGYLWLRAKGAADVIVALESDDGSRNYATQTIHLVGNDEWIRTDFALTPDTADAKARFSIRLASPGSITIGHAFLQPGEWGRFKGLPVRKDVADAMIEQGISALRYGGSMVNEPDYRWKRMIGPRDRRLPYRGHWYEQSSNGWGIVDFLDFCAASGIDGTPDFCLDESPQDMADFVDFALGDESTEWGRRRIQDGHREPYPLKQIEIGNEERVDDRYLARFEPIADAIWAKYPKLVLVVGDFNYNDPIVDPMHFTGADSKITSLAAHQKIMAIAKRHDADVWFDVHINTENPPQARQFLAALKTYIDAIDSLADGAKHRVVVFELNSNRHTQNRALASAIAIGALQRDGRLPIVASANGLQPDGQNDNGWDQGLIFLNPTQTWFQPPAYAAQMITRSYLPLTIDATVTGDDAETIDVTAARSQDGKSIVLRLVNPGDRAIRAKLLLDHFKAANGEAARTELVANPDSANTADNPRKVAPRETKWKHDLPGDSTCELPAHSIVVLKID